MDFGLSEEQDLLQSSAKDFLMQECPPPFVRALLDDKDGFSPELHRKMAELGWTGLLVPEKYSGMGLSMLDAALLLEEMGRAVVPGPFLFSSVLATFAIMQGVVRNRKKRGYLDWLRATQSAPWHFWKPVIVLTRLGSRSKQRKNTATIH